MAWSMDGTYLENCNCDAPCPCTWSWLKWRATHDRCYAFLAYHIDTGDIESVDVSDLSFALVIDAPPNMGDGNWRVGVIVDDNASQEQADKLGAVLSGQMGGPPAMLAPVIGEIMGVEMMPIQFEDDGRQHRVRVGDAVNIEVEDMVNDPFDEPVTLTNIPHPTNSTLTVAPAVQSTFSVFGVDFAGSGTSGFSAPFSWSGA